MEMRCTKGIASRCVTRRERATMKSKIISLFCISFNYHPEKTIGRDYITHKCNDEIVPYHSKNGLGVLVILLTGKLCYQEFQSLSNHS